MKTHHLVLALALSACDSGKSPTPPPANPEGRVVAVAAAANQANTSDLCDVLKPAASAPAFAYPAVEGSVPAATSGWRWINVWATWCPPCIEELPLISKVRSDLAAQGTQVSLELVSVDNAAEAVQTFATKHPEAKSSLRVTEASALEPWLVSLGLDAGATLPIHIFVDPAGKVRCARTGAVRDSDIPLIKKLLAGG